MAQAKRGSNKTPARQKQAPVRQRSVQAAPAAVAGQRTISWRHCLVGLVVGEVILLLLSNLGSLAANAAFGGTSQGVDGGVVGVSTLIAVLVGGYLAARLAGRFGLYQGIVVAIGFIAWGAIFQFLQEAQVVASSISAGGHTLVDLGPMDMGSLISGDLLALFGGSVGGLLSGKR
jgi:hypothetical protein